MISDKLATISYNSATFFIERENREFTNKTGCILLLSVRMNSTDYIIGLMGRKINEEEYPVISVWGLRFRSKTEALIYDRLRANELLVLYEPDMMLGNRNISPDFVIVNKRTGKEYVWEHFGKMKDPYYINKNKKKMNSYIDNGYIPNINMIVTYEIDDNSVNLRYVESLIEQFLL